MGYFVEVTAGQAPALKANGEAEKFIHRQTMASAMRFTTTELARARAENRQRRRPRAFARAFDLRRPERKDRGGGIAIRDVARALAEIDVASALAELAASENYVRPKVDLSLAFRIEGGRHPVVEQALRAEGQSFVANDCDLGASRGSPGSGDGACTSGGGSTRSRPGRIWLLTGPNMAGKSTFLRQNALIAILAQAGSFVPAKAAHIGIVDAVFSRVGAADDLARGRSTFMVEMVETAAILNQAGPRSLVILDEIGRGTATFDGLSIAWAAVEHLHEANLFARALRDALPRADRARRKAPAAHERHHEGEGVEGRRRVPARGGGGRRRPLLRHPGGEARRAAAAVIAAREAGADHAGKGRARTPRADHRRPAAFRGEAGGGGDSAHPALAALEAINPDELSPKEALERLYELKRLGRSDKLS